jgi:hypothetical protein
MLLRLLPLSPAWVFVPPAVVFAWGCALGRLADGLERLLLVHRQLARQQLVRGGDDDRGRHD